MNKSAINKLFSNTFTFAIGNLSSRLMIFLLVPIYARTLSNLEYGYTDLINVTISLLLPIFAINIHEAVIRFTLEKSEEISHVEILRVGLGTTLIGCIPVLIIGPIVMSLLGNLSLAPYLVIVYVLTAIKNVMMYYSRGMEKVKAVIVIGFIETFLLLTLNVLFLLYLKLSLFGYFFSQIISLLVASVIYIHINRADFKLSIKTTNLRQIRKQMLKYSIPMIPNSLSWWISNTSDKYIITFFLSVQATGVYAIAYKIPSLLNTVTKIFMDAWQISSVEEYAKNSEASFTSVFNFFYRLNVFGCFFLIMFSNVIGKIMFSQNFISAVQFVPILLLAYLFNGLASYLGTIYTTSLNTKMLFYSTGIGAIVNITLNILLIPTIGVMGAAIATCVSYFSIFLFRLIDTGRLIKIHFSKTAFILNIGILTLYSIYKTLDFFDEYEVISILIFLGLLLLNKQYILKFLLGIKQVFTKIIGGGK
ncbi:lipopolysaccharide biosynthesis protein [Enterococcus dongliensis]|uniref:lipopolysaccharide biosynthesis protein n=1 Tax=Enterococcus dongliensis TaxID=2559925 RepID=UPI00288CCFF1|nr:oligosaccharide flippase family protein [Enterococcus dongliensis]MDT2674686.1 oligosaccharide flippase family protein [Enterococcus dongliensis]